MHSVRWRELKTLLRGNTPPGRQFIGSYVDPQGKQRESHMMRLWSLHIGRRIAIIVSAIAAAAIEGEQGEQGPPGPPTYLDTYMVSERFNLSGSEDEGGEGGSGGGDGRSFAQTYRGYELIADGDMESAPVILATRPNVQEPSNGGEDSDAGGEQGPDESVESWLVSVEHSGLNGVDVWAICNVTSGEEG